MMRSQSGLQKRGVLGQMGNPHGLLVRGVVMATYVLDDPGHPSQTETSDDGKDPVAVYCDVLVYSALRACHSHYLTKVPVSQDRGSLHDGRIWMPKATSIDVTGAVLDPNTGTRVANMDGDHVLVGFMDDALNLPVILAGIPHPSHDVGNLDRTTGHRRGLKLVDGHPDLFKHHGTVYGVLDNGDYRVDTTHANDGKLNADGTEPDPPTDGKGAQRFDLPQDAEQRIEWWDMVDPMAPVSKSYILATKDGYEIHLDGGATLKVELKDGGAKLTLGDGAKSAIIAEAWQAFFDGTLKTWITTHTHPTGVGPSGAPLESAGFPAYSASNATSTKLKFPDA